MKGMLFTPDMAQAIFDGGKSQTRRVLKPQPLDGIHLTHNDGYCEGCGSTPCAMTETPYKVGDRLCVKEPHWAYGYWITTDELTKTGERKRKFVRCADNTENGMGLVFPIIFDKPEITLPQFCAMRGWYRRNSLFHAEADTRSIITITDVRVQRLQDISEADAIAEGILEYDGGYCAGDRGLFWAATAKTSYEYLINSIHGPDTWARNAWFAAYTFTREKV